MTISSIIDFTDASIPTPIKAAVAPEQLKHRELLSGEWWRKIPQSSSRAVTIELPENPKQAVHILTQLTNASAQFAAVPVAESFENDSDIYH
jgi:hypothetical protein